MFCRCPRTARLKRSKPGVAIAKSVASAAGAEPAPVELRRTVLVDTGVWSWVRDRRHPHLAPWFNAAVSDGRVATCELVLLELTRTAANATQARALRRGLAGLERVGMPETLWASASLLQDRLADAGDHRRVPPADLLIAAAAIEAEVPLLHYDRDYERIAAVADLDQRWFVPDGSLA